MKVRKLMVMFFVYILIASCNDNRDFMLDSGVIKSSSNKIDVWNKDYSPVEIVKLKKYVKAIKNRLVFTKSISFVIDSLGVCQRAYEDLLANIADVNNVLETAERDSFEINLQYPFPHTKSLNRAGCYVFSKNKKENFNFLPRIKTKSESGGEIVELASMEANSRCSFVSGTVSITSRTFVNTSLFYWTFMIYDEVWDKHQGTNGVGVIGEDRGYIEYPWTYSLDSHTGEFNWRFRNVSSSTDGVAINHSFWGGKVK